MDLGRREGKGLLPDARPTQRKGIGGLPPIYLKKIRKKEPSTITTTVTTAHYFFRFVYPYNAFNWKRLLCFIFKQFSMLKKMKEGKTEPALEILE